MRFWPKRREARYFDRHSLPRSDGLLFIESVNKFGKDVTPLHVAAAYGDLKLFKLIMDLSDKSNLLMGIDNWSGAVRSVV